MAALGSEVVTVGVGLPQRPAPGVGPRPQSVANTRVALSSTPIPAKATSRFSDLSILNRRIVAGALGSLDLPSRPDACTAADRV